MGSVCRFTHFFLAHGFMCPQNPSFGCGTVAVGGPEGCCCAVAEGGMFCVSPVDCELCASAGIPTANDSRRTASLPDNGAEVVDEYLMRYA